MLGVEKIHGDETLLAASERCRAMVCGVDEVNYLSGPGKGVMLIKLGCKQPDASEVGADGASEASETEAA